MHLRLVCTAAALTALILDTGPSAAVSQEKPAKLKILITGSAGQIGSTLVKGLSGKYDLRGLDIRPTAGLEDSIVGDVRDFETILRAAKGINAIVHLANVSTGSATDRDRWEDLMGNMTGTYNVLEAARQSGIRRVVYASRAGLLGPYPQRVTRTVELLPRPESFYSVSKVFGENLGYMYSVRHNIEFVAVRIGNFNLKRPLPEHPHQLGHGDAIRVFERAVIHPGVKYEVIFGVSDSSWKLYDLDHGKGAINYHPQDKSMMNP